MADQGEHALSERAQHLLRTLVQRHIRDGQPVGSRTLLRDSGLDVSPATVRNGMAELERAGYVHAPHTSAGRIPTQLGYRVFVDSLLTLQPLQQGDIQSLRDRLAADDPSRTVDSASDVLAGLTRLTGVVTRPRRDVASVRHIEFLRLGERRVLAIIVLNDHEVQNRVLHTERDFSSSELERIGNYLSHQFAGQDLGAVRRQLIADMQAERAHMDELMRSAMDVATRVFTEQAGDEDYVITGETNLMTFEELSDVDKLKELFDAFSRKQDILHLLDRCLDTRGVQIFIGEECGYDAFEGVSLVTSTYSADDEVLGVLGVIGPTRMDYDRVIPIVDVTARLLGHALNPDS
jgi:heat-inducible transcriptional repressor